MNKGLWIAIIGLIIANGILIYFAIPKPPGYCHFSSSDRLIYLLANHGMGLILFLVGVIPASIIALMWSKSKPYRFRLNKTSAIVGIVLNGLLLSVLSLGMTVEAINSDNPSFQDDLFSELQGTTRDTASIREGKFEHDYGYLIRTGDRHILEYANGEVIEYKIEWLSNNEYLLHPILEDDLYNGAILHGLITEMHSDGYVVYHDLCGIGQRQELKVIPDN